MIRDMSSDGASVFGRSAKEVVGGARPGAGKPVGAGRALWREPWLGVEDLGGPQAQRASGAAAVPARTAQSAQLGSVGLQLTDHPAWTLGQLQAGLKKQTGVGFSAPYVWLRLKGMNFRLKKVTPRPRARQRSQPKAAHRVP